MVDGQQRTGSCRHYWIIESPRGPVSSGLCRDCGEGREFKNYIEETSYDDESRMLPRDDWDL